MSAVGRVLRWLAAGIGTLALGLAPSRRQNAAHRLRRAERRAFWAGVLRWLALAVAACIVGLLFAMTDLIGRCYEVGAMLRAWAEHAGETSVALGASATGTALQLLAARDGNWTLVRVHPNGRACIVDVGAGIQITPRRPTPGEEARRGSWWNHPERRTRDGTQAERRPRPRR
jgi:hypothetical protein